jgi:hypothetical protein
MKHKSYLIIFIILFLNLFCTNSSKDNSTILIELGSKKITSQDILQRAELTVRPGNIKTLNAILNNLIVEKLFAIEAGDTNILSNNESFRSYIKGLKEQKMRELLYERIAVHKVKLDPDEIQTYYNLSQRVYHTEFFTVNNSQLIEKINNRIQKNSESRNKIFEEIAQTGIGSEHVIKWKDHDHDEIHGALFSKPLNVGHVLGPIRLSNDQSIMIKITNISIYPVIGQEDAMLRMNEVKEKLNEIKAKSYWNTYKKELMQGKQIKFEKNIFNQIVNLYLAANKELKESSLPGSLNSDKDHSDYLSSLKQIDELLDQPFFKVDNQVWTVEDFKKAIMSHPLVYRQKQIPPSEFAMSFKIAIADLITDHYLNQEAYRKSLDKNYRVKKKAELWSDALIAKYHLDKYMDSNVCNYTNKQNSNYVKLKTLDAYLHSLSKKYESQIKINTEAFKEIQLTEIPLFAIRPGLPYPVVVPEFPNYMTADTLLFNSYKSF